jgi:ribosomal protein S3
MGQKTNPNIFQLGKTNNWQSKYFGKKITEHAIYSRKDLEIRNFIQKFFRDHGRIIHHCKLCYLNKSLHIFVSYHLNLSSLSFAYENIPKIYTIKTKKTKKKLKRQKIVSRLLNLKSKIFNSQIKKRNYRKTRAMHSLMKNFFDTSSKLSEFPDDFIQKFSKSLTNFTLKKFKLIIHLKASNINKDPISKIKIQKLLKQKLVNLRKYKQTEFFKEGINVLFTCATQKKSSKLLAQFIAIQLKSLKRHNFFLKFVKSALTLFRNNVLSTFKGIKIKIKGRLNSRPRARSQVFKIANDVSALTINSTINYSEETAFTPNGTLGIKVWIHETSD